MAGPKTKEKELERRARARFRVIEHYLKVTRNVSQTSRYFGISRRAFYTWWHRYREHGVAGLRDRSSRPNLIHYQIPPDVIALICKLRREKDYGAPRLSLHLQRYHQVYVSPCTIGKIFRQHGLRQRSWKGYRAPKKVEVPRSPGESLQVDVKFVPRRLTGSRRFYQFTAIDEATRFRILRVYDHNSTQSAIAFLDEVRRVFPIALKRVQTDNGPEFGWNFTWHLKDAGIDHRRIPPGCPEANGKVERSHRTDSEEFYRHIRPGPLKEIASALAEWEREYNFGRPHLALRGYTPAERLTGDLKNAKRGVKNLS